MYVSMHDLCVALYSANFHNSSQWAMEHIDIPLVTSALYLALVLWVPDAIMQKRERFYLRRVAIAWNLVLCVFSSVGWFICAPRLYEIVTAPVISNIDTSTLPHIDKMTSAMRRNVILSSRFGNGVDTAVGIRGSLDTSICVWRTDMYRHGVTGLMSLLFAVSKIPEMFDTVLLVLQKKPVIFLHWFHHLTVMLYCWHSWITQTSSGFWFITMNYGVHSIMYLYYFICSLGYRRFVRPFASFITFLQIAQMFVGVAISLYTFYMDAIGRGCDCVLANTKLSMMMYAVYMYFFCSFFYKSYMTSKCNLPAVSHVAKKVIVPRAAS